MTMSLKPFLTAFFFLCPVGIRKEYRGTLLVVSHDACFVQQINIEKTITLNM